MHLAVPTTWKCDVRPRRVALLRQREVHVAVADWRLAPEILLLWERGYSANRGMIAEFYELGHGFGF